MVVPVGASDSHPSEQYATSVTTLRSIAADTRLPDAAKAGVVIAFGTDAGSPAVPHSVVAPEMKFMVDLGVVDGNYGALRSATIVAARIHKLDDRIGTLEAGKLADVIVVDGDPLADLAALEAVTMTYVEGARLV